MQHANDAPLWMGKLPKSVLFFLLKFTVNYVSFKMTGDLAELFEKVQDDDAGLGTYLDRSSSHMCSSWK
jgi:hypothetical protein